MDNFSYLEVVYENVESIIIPENRISKLKFGELEEFHNEMFEEETFTTNKLLLDIKYFNDKELLEYDPSKEYPLGVFVNNPISNNVEDRPHILGSLTWFNNITCIELLDENMEVIKRVYIPWGESEYENDFMKINISDGIISIEVIE